MARSESLLRGPLDRPKFLPLILYISRGANERVEHADGYRSTRRHPRVHAPDAVKSLSLGDVMEVQKTRTYLRFKVSSADHLLLL